MLRKMINSLLRKLVKATEAKTVSVEDYCKKHTDNTALSVKTGSKRTSEKIDVTTVKTIMAERILETDEIKEQIGEIKAQIYVKGYKVIPEILPEYDIQVVQAFVLNQMITLGEYAPEHDNLDQYGMDELVSMAMDLNQLQFEQRMIAQGKAQITAAQINAINTLSKKAGETVKMPTNKFEASRLIEKLKEKVGDNRKSDGTPTENQKKLLAYLCKTLAYPLPVCNTSKEASEWIAKLNEELNKHPELKQEKMATTAQIEYAKRLYKSLGKRWTKTTESKYAKMTIADMGKALLTLKEDYEANHPEAKLATEGQIKYIGQLCRILEIPYDLSSAESLTKEQATAKLIELRKSYLKFLLIGQGTKDVKFVDTMKDDAVKELINQVQLERKTKHYTSAPESHTTPWEA
jgi:hypothetical protein